jgi:hypothetical protein
LESPSFGNIFHSKEILHDDALLSISISVPYGRPKFGTMGSECTLVPNTLIVSLVHASLPTTQTMKEFLVE